MAKQDKQNKEWVKEAPIGQSRSAMNMETGTTYSSTPAGCLIPVIVITLVFLYVACF